MDTLTTSAANELRLHLQATQQHLLRAAELLADEPEENEEPKAYARRLRDLSRLASQSAIDAAGTVIAALTEFHAHPWPTERFTGKTAMRVFGLMREAKASYAAALHCAEPVGDLAALGLFEAAWFKASDAVFFGGLYLNIAAEMVQIALDAEANDE